MPGVAAGRFDAGLVIHEARFTYPRLRPDRTRRPGRVVGADTGLPIPLGAILARRGRVDAGRRDRVGPGVGAAGVGDPAASEAYVLAHAQEMEPDVVAQHIALYVNEFTEDLGDEGYAAVNGAARPGRRRLGLVPPVPPAGSTAEAQTSSSRATACTSSATSSRPSCRGSGRGAGPA